MRNADTEVLLKLVHAKLQVGDIASARALVQRARATAAAASAPPVGFDVDTRQRSSAVASALELSAADAKAGQPVPAANRLQALMQAHPDDALPALALAALLERSKDTSDRASALLAQAVVDHPGKPRASLAYAAHLQREGQWQAARSVLQTASTAMAGNFELLNALSSVQMHERELEQARVSANKWAILQTQQHPSAAALGRGSSRPGCHRPGSAFAAACVELTAPIASNSAPARCSGPRTVDRGRRAVGYRARPRKSRMRIALYSV